MKFVLAIDGSNWVHRAWHVPAPPGSRNHAASVFCQMLEKADRTLGPSHLVVAFDHPSPTWRHDLFAGYKAGREAKSPDLVEQLELASKAAQAYGCQVFSVPGVEADDVLATIATRASSAGVETIIGSTDKDLMQLCGERVKLLDANYNVMGPAQVEAKWGVPPDKLRDLLAIAGDSSDGIPGVAGIGPATAATLVCKYGSALDAVAHSAEVGGKRGAALSASAEAVGLGLRLVELRRDVDLGVMLRATQRTPEKFAEFRRKLEAEPPVSRSIPCSGICDGVPGRQCSLCGGSGKETVYHQQRLAAQEWDQVTKRG